MTDTVDNAHRLLAPRVAYLIGTRDARGEPNLIPVSNVTSVSTDPQHIAVAVYKQWDTYCNLLTADGFTLSVPLLDHLRGVWILGAKYSGYAAKNTQEKLAVTGLDLDHQASPYGPVLASGTGWMQCRTTARIDLRGNHGLIIGEVRHVWFNPDLLTPQGIQRDQARPLMQVSGNHFTTAARTHQIPYHKNRQ